MRRASSGTKDQLFVIIPLRQIQFQENRGVRVCVCMCFFLFLEPKVHGQSSPMCLHPPRSRSLIFQHYKLEASSHFSEHKCKEMFDMHSPRSSQLLLISQKSADRVLFFLPPSSSSSSSPRSESGGAGLRFIHLDTLLSTS